MANDLIVVFNAGSASLRFAAYTVEPGATLSALRVGRIESLQSDPHVVVEDAARKPLDTHQWGDAHLITHAAALK